MGKLCIIGVDDNKVLKDFIRAHVEYLSGDKVCLNSWFPNYAHEGKTIRHFYTRRPLLKKIAQLLPHFLYQRTYAAWQNSPAGIRDAFTAFFRQHDVDVILAEFGPTGADICPLAKALDIPLVVHFHGHDAHRTSVVNQYRERYRAMFAYAQAIISVSHYMTEALVRLGADPAKIIYNPYGPRDRFFSIEPDYSSQTILSVGRFTDIKAPYLTLLAFKLLREECPQARLIMAGDEGLLETCKTLAQVWGLDTSVEFPGAVNHAEVLPLFARACCFVQHSVVPSYGDAEGTPVVILEAQAAGLPVVATRHAGIRDAVVHGKTGFLVEERDVIGMKNNLSTLLDNPNLCHRMGMAARSHIQKNYSLASHIKALEESVAQAKRVFPRNCDGT